MDNRHRKNKNTGFLTVNTFKKSCIYDLINI